ncbi:MAG: hypothetical protein QHH24_01750 [Candidatus Bathyarchaeota archaeon]|nr:hypothetical protein [Candidatus Bathyarchaeota archaeon]
MVFASVYVVDYHRLPPDLEGDVDCDGMVTLKDILRTALTYGSFLGQPKWYSQADVIEDRVIDLKDYSFVVRKFGTPAETPFVPVAYSTSFEFNVPGDGEDEIYYYVYTRIYVSSSNTFYLWPSWVDDWILNVKVDNQLKYDGSVGDPSCQPRQTSVSAS